jgi:hypothetical protein
MSQMSTPQCGINEFEGVSLGASKNSGEHLNITHNIQLPSPAIPLTAPAVQFHDPFSPDMPAPAIPITHKPDIRETFELGDSDISPLDTQGYRNPR